MPLDDARDTGASTVGTLKAAMERRLAKLLQRDPDLLGTAVEVGIVDRDWLDEPGHRPISKATPVDVLQRFLERSVERKPSALTSFGLNAIQALSWNSESEQRDGSVTELGIVFTDLEGFTRYTEREGDDAALALIDDHDRAIGPIVRSRGGKIVKRLGDGLMLSFPSADAAVYCALELVPAAPDPLRLRAGVHWGEVTVTRGDVLGHVVNVAARVTESAKGDQVVVTAAARDAAGDLRNVEFTRLRRRSFKGVAEPVSVCRADLTAP